MFKFGRMKNSLVGSILNNTNISSINPFIHRIVLSSMLDYKDLSNMYPGKIKVLGSAGEKSNYKKKGILWIDDGVSVELFYNPNYAYMPQSIIRISNPNSSLLRSVSQKIDELNEIIFESTGVEVKEKLYSISSIEYTVDFYCKNAKAVGDLYYLLRRYVYFPYCKRTSIGGGNFYGYNHDGDYCDERDFNAYTHYWYSKDSTRFNNKVGKIYERGPDKLKCKKTGGWKFHDCDRVRYEVTVRRSILNDLNLNCFEDLGGNMHFSDFFFPTSDHSITHKTKPSLFQFKQFIDREYREYRPPSDFEDFSAGIEDGDFESFQQEYFKAKRKGLNVSNSTEQSSHFEGLKKEVRKLILKYERDW